MVVAGGACETYANGGLGRHHLRLVGDLDRNSHRTDDLLATSNKCRDFVIALVYPLRNGLPHPWRPGPGRLLVSPRIEWQLTADGLRFCLSEVIHDASGQEIHRVSTQCE